MIETLPITPMSTALGAMLVELQLLASCWPEQVERRIFEGARAQLHRDVSQVIARLPPVRSGRPVRPSILDPDAKLVHDAYMIALVIAVMVKRLTRRARKRQLDAPSTVAAAAAGAALLDAFEPYVQWEDIAVRRFMLDGKPLPRNTHGSVLQA